MYLLSQRYKLSILLLSLILIFFRIDAFSQIIEDNPRTIPLSGGSRTYNANVTSNSSCPNTYEYVPNGYDFNDKTKKYPLIISLPGLSEMIQAEEATNLLGAAKKLIDQNQFLGSGVQLKIERGEFPPISTYMGQDYQFIVVTIQCFKDAGNEKQAALPTHIDDVLSNYIILNKYLDKIDLDRIYLTGTSRGGGLCYEFMENLTRASKIAAIVPVAPGSPFITSDAVTGVTNVTPSYANRFNTIVTNIAATSTLGVYATHNQVDNQVHINAGRLWVNSINGQIPARAQLREFQEDPAPLIKHNAWYRTYNPNVSEFNNNTNNVYQWMLSRTSIFSALPVTLTSFDAVAKNNAVDLIWNTASESNSSHFAVEHSSNGREFKEIGRVNSSGNSTTAKNYKFTDNSPLTGNNYYRLKMVDLDATFKYSEVRRVSMNGSDLEFSFGPNPVINEASIRITGNQRTRLNLTITDLMGRALKTMSFSKSDIVFSQKINLAELPAGQYILSVKGDNVSYTQRIMKR